MPNGENHVGRITYSSVLKVDAVGDTGKQDRERAIFIILDSAPSLVVASARRHQGMIDSRDSLPARARRAPRTCAEATTTQIPDRIKKSLKSSLKSSLLPLAGGSGCNLHSKCSKARRAHSNLSLRSHGCALPHAPPLATPPDASLRTPPKSRWQKRAFAGFFFICLLGIGAYSSTLTGPKHLSYLKPHFF